jgi:hypothetical protein
MDIVWKRRMNFAFSVFWPLLVPFRCIQPGSLANRREGHCPGKTVRVARPCHFGVFGHVKEHAQNNLKRQSHRDNIITVHPWQIHGRKNETFTHQRIDH